MQKSGGIRAGFQGLEGGVVPVKIKALASLRSSDYRWIAGIAARLMSNFLQTKGKAALALTLRKRNQALPPFAY